MGRWTTVAGLVVVAVGTGAGAWGQEYLIRKPADAASAPVHLTEPVTGRVEVLGAEPLDVRVVGGSLVDLDGPLTVQGEVDARIPEPLAVEVVNFPERPGTVQVGGTVRVDDGQPVRVWVENQIEPARAPGMKGRFTAYVFRGRFEAREGRVRGTFSPAEGRVFQLRSVVVDTRRDAVLRVRVLAPAEAVDGDVNGGGRAPVPLVVTGAAGTQLAAPVPLAGPFTLEVEAPGPGQGAPFTVVLSGETK